MTHYESSDSDHEKKESIQEDKIKNAIYEEYRHQIPDTEQEIKELKQLNEINGSLLTDYKKTELFLRRRISFLIISIVIVGVFVGTLFFSFNVVQETTPNEMTSQFLIQNLKGDIINTWVSWKIVEGDQFHIHLKDSKYVTQERANAIMETIMSTEEIEIEDSLLHKGPEGSYSTYYVGWFGGLNSIDSNTENPIPKELHFHITDKGEGNILVELTNLSNPDGYSGYTKAIVDDQNHQILKATITIYNIEKLSIEELKTIFRHELGHGFGLAHSTAPEDLMHPVIETDYPYISDCDLDAISLLYDGGQTSQVICDK